MHIQSDRKRNSQIQRRKTNRGAEEEITASSSDHGLRLRDYVTYRELLLETRVLVLQLSQVIVKSVEKK